MNLFYIWAFSLVLAFLWWVFVVAKIHAYKFKAFSKKIPKLTNLLFIALLLLSLLWYSLILVGESDNTTTKVNKTKKVDYIDY